MTEKHRAAKSNLVTLIWATGIAGVVLAAVVIVSGQYHNLSFWLSTAAALGLAYLVGVLPRHHRPLRYPMIAVGLLLPNVLNAALRAPTESTPDISAATIVFVMALFWLPVIRHARRADDG